MVRDGKNREQVMNSSIFLQLVVFEEKVFVQGKDSSLLSHPNHPHETGLVESTLNQRRVKH